MVKTGKIRRNQALQELRRHVATMRKPSIMFLINCVSKSNSFVLEGDFPMSKNKLYIALSTTIHGMKPTWPVEPILLISTLLMGESSGRRRRSRLLV